jgi:protein O-GlcNAc transferase
MERSLIENAIRYHRAGQLQLAENAYHRVIARQPQNGDALNLLGVLYRQRGQHVKALDCADRALRIKWSSGDFHFNRGEALRALTRYEDAVAAYREASARKRDDPEILHALGSALRALGKPADAIETLQQAVRARPNLTAALDELAKCLITIGRLDDAAAAYRDILTVMPNDASAHLGLGNVFWKKGSMLEAVDAYRQATRLKPLWLEAQVHLGEALAKQGEFAQATAALSAAISMEPSAPQPHIAMAIALDAAGDLTQAETCCRRGLELRPSDPDAYNTLGRILDKQGRLSEAEAAYRECIRLKPKGVDALSNLGNTLKNQGRLAESVQWHRQAVALAPSSASAHSNLLFALNYGPQYDRDKVFAEHVEWSRKFACDLPSGGHSSSPDCFDDVRRPLRIGYVSSDFHEHSVAYFAEVLLAGHSRSEFGVYCYSGVARPDLVTERLRGYDMVWRSTIGRSDEQVVEMIRLDRIDILVDLVGHTGGSRLPVFAGSAAPVQVSYLGYPNTTGLPGRIMPYRITDALADPPGMSEKWHTESLVRLPETFLCYRPPLESPAVAPVPHDSTGRITFGSFNQLAKLNEETVQVWCEILKTVTNSRMVLKAKALRDGPTRDRIAGAFARHGIAAGRVELCGPEPSVAGHLARYANVDIALDTFPYHGTTTTCEALWMGVPVVTLAGGAHVSRVGVSLLSNVGLAELVATSRDGYIRVAADLAGDLTRLRELRMGLRAAMRCSPLMEETRFVAAFESTCREMWVARRSTQVHLA